VGAVELLFDAAEAKVEFPQPVALAMMAMARVWMSVLSP
jgi:hypothetical protein